MSSEDIFNRIREMVRALRWSALEKRTAMLGTLCLGLAGYLKQDLIPVPDLPAGASLGLLILGLGLLAYTTYRLWTRTLAPKQVEFASGPVAIKGASAFTQDDAELFSRLGRREELTQLRSWILDDQVPLIVVMGESGVGKTSLLRAGLAFALGSDEKLTTAYWEATPEGAWESLQRSLSEQLPEPDSRQPSVVLVDQAEQLGPENGRFFRELQELVEAEPPYRTTFVVAFRREFLPDWMDFQLTLDERSRRRIQTQSLKRFEPARARGVFSTLAEEAELDVKTSLVDGILSAIAEGGTVSPVDLGITLQMLARSPDLAQNVAAYRSVGGHAALITNYLEAVLEPYSSSLREEVFRGLLALADRDEDRRLAEGRPLDALLAASRTASPRHLRLALETLAQPGVRVLEEIGEEARRYRLVHERFIPAVRRLGGELLSETDQASRLLERRYRAWEREQRSRRFLLLGRELSRVESSAHLLRWGQDQDQKREFFDRSVRRRSVRRTTVGLIGLLIAGAVVVGWRQLHLDRIRRDIAAWGGPAGIYEVLPRVQALDLGLKISESRWLARGTTMEELSLWLPGLKEPQLRGLPQSLERLTLSLAESRVESLSHLPNDLRYLKLDLQEAQVQSLEGLPSTLRELDLDLFESRVESLKFLPPNLRQLRLDLQSSGVESLEHLPRGLRELSLDLTFAEIKSLEFLPRSLNELYLNLTHSEVESLEHLPQTLEHLTLVLAGTRIGSLEFLPTELRTLDLDLGLSEVRSLRHLPSGLQRLELDLGASKVATLEHLPAGLQELYLSLRDSELSTLRHLPSGLQTLSLYPGDPLLLSTIESPLPTLRTFELLAGGATFLSLSVLPASLEDLRLDLVGSELPELPSFPPGLKKLRLSLNKSKTSELGPLPAGLEELQLNLSRSQIDHLGMFPAGIEALTLTISSSRVQSLGVLPSWLRQLSLDLSWAKVRTLRGLPEGLEELSLSTAYSSLQSLDHLPASLRQLSLYLGPSGVSTLAPLPPDLRQLKLSLRGSPIDTLQGLPRALRRLDLNLENAKVGSLEHLPTSVEELVLRLDGSDLATLDHLPLGLRRLSLQLGSSEVLSLGSLPAGLQELGLDVVGSKLESLAGIPPGLTCLTLQLSPRQAYSLKELPSEIGRLSIHIQSSSTVLPSLPACGSLSGS